jgi:membrane-associated phospholipid phosphatase
MSMPVSWSQLLHLGDLSLTIPTGSAIAAWLLAGRAWRAAVGWTLVFGLALGLVAATKIAFMGWATGLPALDFKAVSGHATGFAAVFPTLCYLLGRGRPAPTRTLGACAGLALAAVVAAALVHAGEHTLAEALAGWLIGAGVFLCAVHIAGDQPAPPPGRAIAFAASAFLATAWILRSAPLNWWMIKVALVLSGNPAPIPWDTCG